MRHSIIKSLVAATTIAFAGATAAQAGTVTQTSSAVYSAGQDHYDLVVYYSRKASVPLTINDIDILDVAGSNITSQLNNCGTPVKQGDTIVAHTLNPGGYCWLRAFPTGHSVLGQVVVSDSTANTTNINNNVRTNIEVRNASDTTLLQAEVR